MTPLPDVSRRSGVPSYIGTSQIPAPLHTFWWPPGVVLLSGNVLLKGWFSRLSRACFELVRSIFPPKEQNNTRNSPTLSRLKPPRRLCPKIISHSYGESSLYIIVIKFHGLFLPFFRYQGVARLQVPRLTLGHGLYAFLHGQNLSEIPPTKTTLLWVRGWKIAFHSKLAVFRIELLIFRMDVDRIPSFDGECPVSHVLGKIDGFTWLAS